MVLCVCCWVGSVEDRFILLPDGILNTLYSSPSRLNWQRWCLDLETAQMVTTGAPSAYESTGVCSPGRWGEDSCNVGVGTQPHIALAFTVWPRCAGTGNCICVRCWEGGGSTIACLLVSWMYESASTFVREWGVYCTVSAPNWEFHLLSSLFGSWIVSFLSWCNPARIWPTK